MYEIGVEYTLTKSIDGAKLCRELLAIGVITSVGGDGSLVVENRPAEVTDADIQAVIDAHDPTPVLTEAQKARQTLSDLYNGGVEKLTAAQKDTALKNIITILASG